MFAFYVAALLCLGGVQGEDHVLTASGDTALVPLASLELDTSVAAWSGDPMQLIRPDPDRPGQLKVVEETLKTLEQWTGMYEVVSAVGPFHSGKSFLMNQLMGRTSGFELGPTVRPTTEGIWTWGAPLSDGAGLNVLLLDTEGLSAPGNDADYDAKIFAIATLMSSHLLYNSVRIIDEAALEYLELLARRSRLFSLKTSTTPLARDSGGMSGHGSLLNFPALTWVVQDFFQQQVDGESPKEWLHRLMDAAAQAKPNEGEQSDAPSLKDIFSDADCKTLFLPATSREHLTHLDDLASDELTAEYKRDFKELEAALVASLRGARVACVDPSACDGAGRGARGTARTGRELAQMLRLLVTAANTGAMTSLPSQWELFLKAQTAEAKEESQRLFTSLMAPFPAESPPRGVTEFGEVVSAAVEQATTLFNEALFNLHAPYVSQAREQLKSTLRLLGQAEVHSHAQRIETYVNRLCNGARVQFGKFSKKLETTLPVPSPQLDSTLNNFESSRQFDLLDQAEERYPDAVGKARTRVMAEWTNRQNELRHANRQALQAVLLAAQTAAQKRYRLRMEEARTGTGGAAAATGENESELASAVASTGPATAEEMKRRHALARVAALHVFQADSLIASKEQDYAQYEGKLEADLVSALASEDLKNTALVKRYCEKALQKALKGFREQLHHAPLPLFEKELKAHVKTAHKALLAAYSSAIGRFVGSDADVAVRDTITTQVAKQHAKLEERNVRSMKELVEGPLERAYLRCTDIVDAYYVTWTFKKRARSVAEQEIGKALHTQFRTKVIEVWLQDTGVGQAGALVNEVWGRTRLLWTGPIVFILHSLGIV